MPDSGVIQEFLVGLGFKLDEPGLKKFDQALDSGGKKAKTLGTEIEKTSEKVASTTTVSRFRRFTEELGKSSEMMSRFGLASAVTGATVAEEVRRMVDQYENLFFVSQRSGASVGSINALGFGFSQVGLQAADAGKLIDQFGMKARLNPGIRGLAQQFSGFAFNGKNTVKEFTADLDSFFKMPDAIGARYAELIGVDPRTFFNLKDNPKVFHEAMAEYEKANSGNNQDAMAKSAHDLANKMRELGLSVTALKTAIVDRLLGPLNHIADYLIHLDHETHGASTDLIAGLGLTGVAAGAWKLLKHLLPGSGAAATGATATGAAATGGGVMRGLLGGGFRLLGALGLAYTAADVAGDAGITGKGFLDSIYGAADRAETWLYTKTPAPGPAGWLHWLLKRNKNYAPLPPGGGASMGFSQYDWYTPTPADKKEEAAHRRRYFHPSSYHPDGSPLLQNAAFTGRSAADDLSDWLHGNSSFVPAVRLTDQLGASLFGSPGMPGASGTSGGYGGGAPSLFPGPTAPPVGKARAALVQGLYKHLLGEGIDRDHALAILGNANAESSFNAAGAVGSSGERGLFQWLGSRQTAMHAALGGKWLDPYAELDYALAEQHKRDPGWFTRSGSEFDLTNDWERGFERPRNVVDRSSYTKAVESVLKNLGLPSTSSPTTGASDSSGADGSAAQYDREMFGPHATIYGEWVDAVRDQGSKETWAHFLAGHMTGAHLAPSVTHHHAGDKHVTIHAPVTMNVTGITHHDAVDAMVSGMRRTHGDLVRNLKGAVT